MSETWGAVFDFGPGPMARESLQSMSSQAAAARLESHRLPGRDSLWVLSEPGVERRHHAGKRSAAHRQPFEVPGDLQV